MGMLAGTALIVALTSLVPAPNCGLVRTQVLPVTFDSVESAVFTLARARLDASRDQDREWVGGVLRTLEGRFVITEGMGCRGQDTVTFSVPTAAGTELVAFWHTHGGRGVDRMHFSHSDAQVVAQTGKDFYLMTPAGELKVLTADHVRAPRMQYVGDEVAYIGDAQFEA